MSRVLTLLACVSTFASSSSLSARAFGDDHECALNLRSEGLAGAWPDVLDAIRDDLRTRAAYDSCAQVVVSAEGRSAHVHVILADGRTADRVVGDPADLRAALVALLLVVPVRLDAATAQRDQASDPAPNDLPRAAAPNDAPRATTETMLPPRSDQAGVLQGARTGSMPLRVDVALGGGARWTGGHPGGSVLAFADVTVGHWLVGANGRWDQVEGPAGSATSLGYSLQTLEVGVGLGYRVDLGGLGLAAMLGPSVAVLSQQLHDGPAGRIEVANPKTGALMAAPGRDASVARVGAALRATLLTSASIRVFAALDASLDVARDSANEIPNVYAGTEQLPTWGAGVSLGGQLRVWP